MSIPGSKHQRVVERATEVFCRYGFARTTMGDIAERCEISRPALYLLFPDKEAIFTAVVERMDQDKLASIRAEVAHLKDLRGKLLHACLSWGCHGVDLAAAHPRWHGGSNSRDGHIGNGFSKTGLGSREA